MSRGFPSMTALLGLLAVAGFQNRDKLAEMLGGGASAQRDPNNPNQRLDQQRGGLGGLLGGSGGGGLGGLLGGSGGGLGGLLGGAAGGGLGGLLSTLR